MKITIETTLSEIPILTQVDHITEVIGDDVKITIDNLTDLSNLSNINQNSLYDYIDENCNEEIKMLYNNLIDKL